MVKAQERIILKRADILYSDPELKELHASLVGGSLLTEEEFWSAREQQSTVRFAIAADDQHEGMPTDRMTGTNIYLKADEREKF